MKLLPKSCLFPLAGLVALPLAAMSATDAPIDYAAKIAPIFEERCVDCHSGDDAEGDFSLETYQELLKGGKVGKVIEPGKSQDSLLVKFIEGRSGKEGKNKFMPPGKKEHLSADEIALIRQWIDLGAPPPAAPMKIADVLAKLPKIAPKTEHRKAVQALAYSPPAKLIAVGTYAEVQLLNAATHQPVRKIEGIDGKVNVLRFSADGTMLFAAAGDAGISGIAYQWKVADGSLVRKYQGHRDALYALALSPDGTLLATGSYDQKIKLWNVADGTEAKTLSGHNGAIYGLSFRPDGKVLASASADRTVKLWEVATGKRLDTLSQPLKEQKNRHAADLVTTLYAVRGLRDYWDIHSGGFMDLHPDMTFEWKSEPDRHQSYLLKKQRNGKSNDRYIESVLDELLTQPPEYHPSEPQ